MPLPIDLDVEHWIRISPSPGKSEVVKVLGNACFHSSEAAPPELKAPGEPVSGPTELAENGEVTVEAAKWFLQKQTNEERTGKTAIKPATLETKPVFTEGIQTEEIANEAVTAPKIKKAAKPVPGAESLTAVVGAAGGSRVIEAAITAKSAESTYKIKHGLGSLTPAATLIKEKGTAGSETGPGASTAFKELKVVNENEIEFVLANSPAAKEVFYVQIDA
jgi:hypothetical protein